MLHGVESKSVTIIMIIFEYLGPMKNGKGQETYAILLGRAWSSRYFHSACYHLSVVVFHWYGDFGD